MKRAQGRQDQPKKTIEPYVHALENKAKKLAEPEATQARRLAERIERMYSQEVKGALRIVDPEGTEVDLRALRKQVKALLGAEEVR